MEAKLWGTDLPKPKLGDPCNGCGYCCTVEPCGIARDFLKCEVGPCVALEITDGRAVCGMVRNPLGYLFKAAHPEKEVNALEAAPDIGEGNKLSHDIAVALGVGRGCDADDL